MNLKLNKEQKEAVEYKGGPLMIIAGAGTGKTTVITERIKYLIGTGINPSEILALTFTEKAAREMEERVDMALPLGYTQMWISTFHSFCDKVLRSEVLHIGLDPRFRLLTQSTAIQLIRNNIFKFDLRYFRPLGNPTKFVHGMLSHFSRLQDEDVAPKEYMAFVKRTKGEEREKWEELAGAYKKYEELKVHGSYFDYGDLIVKTLELFRRRKSILKTYQKQFKQILVDEYQDTNIAQNELVKLLAGGAKNITVVLDDDQSVYRFRGAAISNALEFRKVFPKTKIVTLTKNYRSKQAILDRAYALIQNNNPDRLEVKEKVDKRLVAQKKGKGVIEFIYKDRVENEADSVAKKIESLSRKYKYSDFALLVRANNHAEPFTRALARHGIPYQFLGPGRLFKQAEIVDLVSYLRVLYNFEDSVSMHRLLSIEHFDLSSRDLAKLGNHARKHNTSLFEVAEPPSLKALEGQGKISKNTYKKISKITELIYKHLKIIRRETAGQILYFFLEETGLLKEMLDPKNAEAQKRAANVSKLFDKLKTYEVDNEDATVSSVVDWIDLATDLGESPAATDSDWTEINAVNILTVHSSKGLEFKNVFLVNLVSQRFPTNQRREQIPIPDALIKEVLPVGDHHIQEERRLFYVGMTRAKDNLFLTAANYYGEGKREKKLSPFISEALGDKVIVNLKSTNKKSSLAEYEVQKEVIRDAPKLKVDYLSYSQIQTFEMCPLHYKLRYILKVPTTTSAAQSFGVSVHESLRQLYGERVQKPNKSYLKKLLKANWAMEGYSSKLHQKQMFERGVDYLFGFAKKNYNPNTKVLAQEQPFLVNVKDKRKIKIGGKIDRVDRLPGGVTEIIDYKTSAKIPTQKQVDKDRQLSFYALAASGIDASPFKEVFKKPENIVLSLYFLHEQAKISTTRTKEELLEAKEYILSARETIENSDFKCSGNLLCKNCEYKLVCGVE